MQAFISRDQVMLRTIKVTRYRTLEPVHSPLQTTAAAPAGAGAVEGVDHCHPLLPMLSHPPRFHPLRLPSTNLPSPHLPSASCGVITVHHTLVDNKCPHCNIMR